MVKKSKELDRFQAGPSSSGNLNRSPDVATADELAIEVDNISLGSKPPLPAKKEPVASGSGEGGNQELEKNVKVRKTFPCEREGCMEMFASKQNSDKHFKKDHTGRNQAPKLKFTYMHFNENVSGIIVELKDKFKTKALSAEDSEYILEKLNELTVAFYAGYGSSKGSSSLLKQRNQQYEQYVRDQKKKCKLFSCTPFYELDSMEHLFLLF